MEAFESQLKQALGGPAPITATQAEALSQQVVQSYGRRLKRAHYLTLGYLAVMVIFMLFFFYQFFITSDLKLCLLYAIAILILYEGTVLMKLWYWMMHSKITTLREIKQLELKIARLAACNQTGANPPADSQS